MTDIAGDALVRKQVRDIIDHSNGAFSIAAFKRIWEFTEVRSSGLFIELSGWNYFKYKFDSISLWLLLLAVISVIVELWILWADRSAAKNLFSIGVVIGCFVVAAITARSKKNYELAQDIDDVLKGL